VGTLGVGIMNSTAFSPLANRNPEVDKIQIPFGTVYFQPHQSNFTQVFESMDEDMDLTIGSLNFRAGSLGSIRLSDLAKPGPSASESKTIVMLESSKGSSSEVNSPVSFAEAEEGKIAEGNETMENFDLEVQLEDLMICHDDTSDKSTDTWKTGLELHEDDSLIFSSFNSKFDNQYQVLAIIGDNSEELDENNNPVLNPANVNRGANHLAEGETADSLATREKIRLSVDEWRIIKTAVEHCMSIPTNASKNMLLGYHYTLRQQSKQLAKERVEIQKRRDSAIAASDAAPRARSDASYTNSKRHRRHGSRFKNLEYSKGKASPKTSTRLSYRSMSKVTLYQRHPKQH
jgi:glycine cleavage system H lipoate-binding protein